MAHEKNSVGLAAIRGDVLDRPADGGTDVLDTRGPGMTGREPIGDVNADQAVARGPNADVFVERAARLRLVAADEIAAMHEYDRGPRVGGKRIGYEHVEPVALVRTVFQVA